MRYTLLLAKRHVEDILLLPLILLGRIIAKFRPPAQEYDSYFFFPFYHVGGAEKVHAAIATATATKNSIIYFTKKSGNNLFLPLFEAAGCTVKDISVYTDNKWLYFLNIVYRGIISGYINRQRTSTIVFNGQCNFGYKLSPWVNKNKPQLELIHSLCSFSYIRIPFLPFIDRTVMISKVRIGEHLELYRRYGIPTSFDEKIQFVLNAIELPTTSATRGTEGQLVVLYVGRSTPEKRVHLIAEMSAAINKNRSRVRFEFLGDVQGEIPEALHPYCHFWGNQSNAQQIDSIYNNANVLMLVSDTEGFPMVIMEAMARGLAIISTPVGEIPLHVINNVNGYLLSDYKQSRVVVDEGIQQIEYLDSHRAVLEQISQANISYAYKHFGMPRFISNYNELFSKFRAAQH